MIVGKIKNRPFIKVLTKYDLDHFLSLVVFLGYWNDVVSSISVISR